MTGPDVEALLQLVLCLCDDLTSMRPSLSRSISRDKQYICNRVKGEGLNFLTKVLPKIGKILDEWFKDEDGTLDFSSAYVSPKFLSGVTNLIQGIGVDDSERAFLIRWMRQLCFVFYKLEVPYTKEQLHEAFSSFVDRDLELETTDNTFSPFDTGEAARILGELFREFSRDNLIPRHGPGSVATGEIGDLKWNFRRKFRSVHRRFPWYEFFVPSLSCWLSDTKHFASWYTSLEVIDYPQARVVAVPKDSRGPRLISEEPLELQFLQQGYFRCLVSHIEKHRLTSGYVNFASQTINQELALSSSKTGAWATIDLSDASDRVSDYLVYLLFPSSIYRDIRALRSYSTILPDGRVVRLNKFAPMGSAICFPIEALVFWALSKSAIRSATKGGDGVVYVYGDDIIVPTEHFHTVCSGLERFGLKVNSSKSYCTGSFRESCGVDAWRGFVVTPARIRQLPPSHSRDHESITNWVACGNLLRANGFALAAQYVFERIDGVIHLPWNVHGTALSHWDRELSHDDVYNRNLRFKRRWSRRWCRPEILCSRLSAVNRVSHLDGWQRLHRDLLVMPRDPDHWSPRRAVKLTRGWVPTHPL